MRGFELGWRIPVESVAFEGLQGVLKGMASTRMRDARVSRVVVVEPVEVVEEESSSLLLLLSCDEKRSS